MTGDTRHTARGSSRSKRRLTGDGDDGDKSNRAADDSNPKRQRVSRACDSCRSKKDKCDGVKPVCSTCASLSRPCTYKANPKKRGLPTGYIRTLELLWGLVFCKIQGSEDVVRGLLKTANIPSHLASMGKETEASDTLLSSFKNSGMLKDIEKMLLHLEHPEDDVEKIDHVSGDDDSPSDAGSSALSSNVLEWQLPQTQGYGGETLTAAGLSPAKTPSSNTSTARLPCPRMTRDCGSQTIDTDVTTDSPSKLSSLRVDLHTTHPPKLPSNIWPLLDIYFSYTQCWFPILEKHDILRTAFRHSEDDAPVDPSSPGSGDYAALWAALALASTQETSNSETGICSRQNCNALYTTARNLIPEESDTYEIGHVQALLILSLVKCGQHKWMTSWILIGQAVRIARFLSLDISQTQCANRDRASPRIKHVLLGCFVLETLISMQTGQVPSLQKDDVTKIGLINEDGLEEWHPWEDQTSLRPGETSRGSFHRGPLLALSTFNHLVSLMCIMNELCYLRQSPTAALSQLEALQRQLQHWSSALSKSYRVDLQNPAKVGSPHIFGLEMMHESVATILNTHVAAQQSDGNGRTLSYMKRATEGARRLLLLLQTYVENYSLAATCPTFGMIMDFGALQTNLSFEAESELKKELQSFLSRLSTVWVPTDNSIPGQIPAEQLPISGSMTLTRAREKSLSHAHSQNSTVIPQTTTSTSINPSRGAQMTNESRRELATPESLIANMWMRTPSNIEGNIPLPLSTPTPSLNTHKSPKESRHRASIPGKPSSETPIAIPDNPTQFHRNEPQYPTPFTEPNLNLDAFVGVDGYGTLQRQRIAPDLDALFDELASLDGTEQADNQPEFMQNLGFVPDAGIPEFYPYTHQVDPS